ncbi:MAG: hypothetical protein PHP85_03400 [Gallionella sp.]|nr:hypothetical protein [Gallionella sp.]
MNPENTARLLAAYPLLYRELREWGFECGDGWFDLIWYLSADIESAARLEGIPETAGSWPSVRILKQKFGSLRVQFGFDVPVSKSIRALVDKASERSTETCELCGAPGMIDRECEQGAWVEALCASCRKTHRPQRQTRDQPRPLPVWMQERNNKGSM